MKSNTKNKEKTMILSRRKLIFATIWATIYTAIFILFMPTQNSGLQDMDTAWLSNTIINNKNHWYLFDLLIPYAWVFLLFLVFTYSYTFFFSLVPVIFITSAVVAYTETTISAPISQNIIASSFDTNLKIMIGTASTDLLLWIFCSVFLLAICVFHFLRIKQKHHWLEKTAVILGFLWLFNTLYFQSIPEKEKLHWRHPFDYINYTLDFLIDSMALEHKKHKTNLGDNLGNTYKDQINSKNEPLQVIVILGESARADHFGLYRYYL